MSEPKMCALCDLPITEAEWDNRHDIGSHCAHSACCIAAGCDDLPPASTAGMPKRVSP